MSELVEVRSKEDWAIERVERETASKYPILKSESEFRSDADIICRKNWTKRGELDVRMYGHCKSGQKAGYLEISYLHLKHLHRYADNPEFYSEIAYPYCLSQWTKRGISDARMIAHCLKQEVEGFKDVEYYKTEHGTNRVNKIVGNALRTYRSWNMAAHEVRRHFEP